MAETLKVILAGDKERADGLRGLAMQRLMILKERMRLGKLSQDKTITVFEDGTEIYCAITFGYQFVEIYCPASITLQKKSELVLSNELFVFIQENIDKQFVFDPSKIKFTVVPDTFYPYESACDWLDLYKPRYQSYFNTPITGTTDNGYRIHCLSGVDTEGNYWSVGISKIGGKDLYFPTVVIKLISPSRTVIINEKICGHHGDYIVPDRSSLTYPNVSTYNSIGKFENVVENDVTTYTFTSAWRTFTQYTSNPYVLTQEWWSLVNVYVKDSNGINKDEENSGWIKHASHAAWLAWVSENFGGIFNTVSSTSSSLIGESILQGCQSVYSPLTGEWFQSINKTTGYSDIVQTNSCVAGNESWTTTQTTEMSTEIPYFQFTKVHTFSESVYKYMTVSNCQLVLDGNTGKRYYVCDAVIDSYDYDDTDQDLVMPGDYFPLPAYYLNHAESSSTDAESQNYNWIVELLPEETEKPPDCLTAINLIADGDPSCIEYEYSTSSKLGVYLPDLGELKEEFITTESSSVVSSCQQDLISSSYSTGKFPIFSYAVGKKYALIGVRRWLELKFYLAIKDKLTDEWGLWEDISDYVIEAFPSELDVNKYTGFFIVPS